MSEDLDVESSQIKDVYAQYGLAMYLAQCLEHGIVLGLIYAKLLPDELGMPRTAGPDSIRAFEKRFDVFMDEHFEMTMGALFSRLQKTATLPSTFDVEFTKARKLRNFLAHSYFRERAEDFISKAGRTAMLAELEEAQKLFARIDDELTAAARSLARAAGLELTKQEHRVAEYLATAYARASARDAAAASTTSKFKT